ncbi:MAG TPA: HD domain-containing protein, partial [Candidatus Limnocylindria bacterium]|nr:HD domain-containing protein [Candidatus Limnocylindria bacterium]
MDLARLRAAPAAVVSRVSRRQAAAEPTHSIEDVVTEARLHRPSINVGLIERAHQVATQAHEGQMRASGEPYVQHPVEVAYYLATLQMDAETLAAALLHDVPEDTDMTIQDIEKR